MTRTTTFITGFLQWMVLVPSNVVWKVFANLPTRDFSFWPLHFGWNSVVESGSWEQTINKHYGRSTGHLKAICSEYEHTCLHLSTFCLHSVWHVSWRWECDLLTSCLAPQKVGGHSWAWYYASLDWRIQISTLHVNYHWLPEKRT